VSRYTGPVVDAHHHFWEPRLGHQPWLRPGAAIPFRYGDYAQIKRDYLPEDLRRDAVSAGIDLVGSVTMETEWELDDPVGEMRYTAALAAEHGLPDAAVAHAVLADPDVDDVLEQLAAVSLVRGVREKPGQAPTAGQASGWATALDDPAWRRGFSRLAAHGLSFELQTAWWHLDTAAELFAQHPEVPVAVNHAGLPSDRSPDAMAAWRKALRSVAALEHVTLKVSGIGVPGRAWTAPLNRPVVEGAVEAFGVDRVMLASNFPVDSLTGSYAEVYGGFLDLTAEWSSEEQSAVFARTAVRTYRLPSALLDGSLRRGGPPASGTAGSPRS